MAYFLVVWSVLLAIHESGHAIVARQHGLPVKLVSVGAGPSVLDVEHGDTRFVLRLIPLFGLTRVVPPEAEAAPGWDTWSREVRVLGGGALATLALVVLLAGAVWVFERRSRGPCHWGRVVLADALILSVFNLLPVPPLDGGQAVLSALSAWRGAPLSSDAVFWLHMGGLALAAVPMLLWTRWTHRIDCFAMTYGARRPTRIGA